MANRKSPSPAEQNPSSNSKRAYYVGGVPVEFPYQPYGTQLAFMGKVISTLDRAQKEGHSHALLESPTGTGKSLSLLCSTLAWQQTLKLKNQHWNLTHCKPDPQAMSDPLAHGGGFVPETQPSSSGNLPPDMTEPVKPEPSNKKEKVTPTIFYASRTHAQISQVVREYRKTSYRVPMTVLASRKHYCTNKLVVQSGNIDEQCKLLMKDREDPCSYFKNMNKVKAHLALQKGGFYEVHDIEDLVKIGKAVKGCPYYAARAMTEAAQLVFCPYSYVINPVIRGAMEVNINGAIIILDEAHNIEDIAREAGSVNLEEDALLKLQTELGQNCSSDGSRDAITYQPLYEMTQDLLSWMDRKKSTLEMRDFQQYYSCWSGDQALRELQEANISQQCFPALLQCALEAIKDATNEAGLYPLSGMSVTILEGLFSSLTYFFARNGSHIADFQLAVQRKVKKDSKNDVGGWTHIFSLWCLNPAVVFKDIADISLSVILTSGTLSPMNSFSSELGVNFGNCLEAPHVVNIKSQVWTAAISTSPGNYPLNASYKTASSFAFQDALGKSLEEIFKVVPAGSLVFFPSYNLMEKLSKRWRETGQWSKLNAQKSLFVEPRGGTQEDFDSVLKSYYNSVSRYSKVPVGNKKRNKKTDPKNTKTLEPAVTSKKDGGAFLAVCRGKASEGIDFSDDNARVVIIVGIPFPNINDTHVRLKKKYNDSFKSSKNLLSGNEWYCHQAFRALNQAAGRCIRHKSDYGAIIFLDERFQEERNLAYVSKWLRNSIQHYESFDESLERLKCFFTDAKKIVGETTPTPVPNYTVKEEKDSTKVLENSCTGESIHKWGELCCRGQKLVAAPRCSPSVNLDFKPEAKPILIEDDIESCQIVDLECNSPKGTRFDDRSTYQDPTSTFVKETPGMDRNRPENLSTGMGCFSSMIQPSYEIRTPTTNLLQVQGSSICSPEKVFSISTFSPSREVDTSLIRSVNSHNQKRRKLLDSPLVLPSEEQSDVCNAATPGCVSLPRSPFSGMDSNDMMQHLSFGSAVKKKLRISCILCKNPLGGTDTDLFVECLATSSSKVHLVSLAKDELENEVENISTKVPVIVTERLSVDNMLCNSGREDAPAEGVWSEQDGCVFKSIFCPYCTKPRCLGVQVMATDASNVQLLNKILFLYDRLQAQTAGTSEDRASKNHNNVPVNACVDKPAVSDPFKRFAYSPQQKADGWRTTKMRLKKGHVDKGKA
ncbi:Fanconi anemia group J protein homolog [Linum perenne]